MSRSSLNGQNSLNFFSLKLPSPARCVLYQKIVGNDEKMYREPLLEMHKKGQYVGFVQISLKNHIPEKKIRILPSTFLGGITELFRPGF